jgi:hypothetical protein
LLSGEGRLSEVRSFARAQSIFLLLVLRGYAVNDAIANPLMRQA